MSKSEPKSLSQLLSSSSSGVGRLAAEARAKLDLTEYVRSGLDAELAGEIVHCDLDANGVLVVRVTNPDWAARLRFENEQLLRLAREKFAHATSVKVKVAQPD